MPAASIRGNRKQVGPRLDINLDPGEIKFSLFLNGVAGTVSVRGIVRIVKKGVHRLVALEVKDSQGLAFLHLSHPVLTCGNYAGVDRIIRNPLTFSQFIHD